ncbi:MAG TPA: hypothetical protein VMP67_02300 [Candidatus Limnocylindria bacterium]|nr:hypothetical protein [Candidatus Limnocylindria bacterium]
MTHPLRRRPVAVLLTAGIVGLSMATAYIHFTLGSTTSWLGLLFLANAVGYVVLAGAVVAVNAVRHPLVERFGWLPRLALVGFTAATIAGYLLMGPYFTLGWITKAIEVGIIALLVLEVVRAYGTPAAFLRSALNSLRRRPEAEAASA